MKNLQGAKILFLAIAVVSAASGFSWSQGREVVEIEAKPVPGQLDLQEGTAIKIGGKPGEGAVQPSSYLWEIVEGEGGRLFNQAEAEAIFQAPTIDNAMELFVIQLTARYPGQEPARTRLHIRVRRKAPEKSIERVMAEQYAREDEAKERGQRRRSNQTVVVHHSAYPSWYGGYSRGWGWNTYYPVYVPIVVPPPGIEWGPGDGEWLEPTPLPYDEIATTFPEHIADDYLPQDHPLADDVPDAAFADGSPTDFIEPPAMQDLPDFGAHDMTHDPGVGGADFAEPMMDPGFGFDDFGW